MNGRVALITGAARGIGRAIAQKFYDHGISVIIVDLKETDIQDSIAAIRCASKSDHPGELSGMSCNVSAPDSVEALFKNVKETSNQLDILVNNAGITRDNLFLRMTFEQWQEVISVNLSGTFLCSRHAASLLRKSPHGRIINLSSVAAGGNPGQANYAASKAGVIGLTKTLALELARYNITVNAIAPGFIETDMTRAIPEKARDEWMSKIALGRPGSADDVAETALFLASDRAAYITGEVIGVDGGLGI